MKGLFAALTAVLLLSVTSVTYAHDTRHERERTSSRYDAPVMVKLIVIDNTMGPAFRMHQYDQRHRGKHAFMRNKIAWKKMKHMQGMNDRYAKNDRHDRDNRHDGHDQHGKHDGNNWYDKYFQ